MAHAELKALAEFAKAEFDHGTGSDKPSESNLRIRLRTFRLLRNGQAPEQEYGSR